MIFFFLYIQRKIHIENTYSQLSEITITKKGTIPLTIGGQSPIMGTVNGGQSPGDVAPLRLAPLAPARKVPPVPRRTCSAPDRASAFRFPATKRTPGDIETFRYFPLYEYPTRMDSSRPVERLRKPPGKRNSEGEGQSPRESRKVNLDNFTRTQAPGDGGRTRPGKGAGESTLD